MNYKKIKWLILLGITGNFLFMVPGFVFQAQGENIPGYMLTGNNDVPDVLPANFVELVSEVRKAEGIRQPVVSDYRKPSFLKNIKLHFAVEQGYENNIFLDEDNREGSGFTTFIPGISWYYSSGEIQYKTRYNFIAKKYYAHSLWSLTHDFNDQLRFSIGKLKISLANTYEHANKASVASSTVADQVVRMGYDLEKFHAKLSYPVNDRVTAAFDYHLFYTDIGDELHDNNVDRLKNKFTPEVIYAFSPLLKGMVGYSFEVINFQQPVNAQDKNLKDANVHSPFIGMSYHPWDDVTLYAKAGYEHYEAKKVSFNDPILEAGIRGVIPVTKTNVSLRALHERRESTRQKYVSYASTSAVLDVAQSFLDKWRVVGSFSVERQKLNNDAEILVTGLLPLRDRHIMVYSPSVVLNWKMASWCDWDVVGFKYEQRSTDLLKEGYSDSTVFSKFDVNW